MEKPTETQNKQKIYKVCLTGGPCSGKTTGISHIIDRLSSKMVVYHIPELATITINAGVVINPAEFTPYTHTVLTKSLIKMQSDYEDFMETVAANQDKDVLILTDRGCMDNMAYCSPEVQELVYKEGGWTKDDISYNRYDLVVHMVTAANGAEEFYTLENNDARTEGLDMARQLDLNTQQVWNGHPNHVIIDNNIKGFDQKMERVFTAISELLGLPHSSAIAKKHLLKGDLDLSSIPENMSKEIFEEEVIFLTRNEQEIKENKVSWIKCRKSPTGGNTWSLVVSKIMKDGTRYKVKKLMTKPEYQMMRIMRSDSKRKILERTVTSLIWNNRNYFIKSYDLPEKEGKVVKLSFLIFDKKFEDEVVELPDFLDVGEDVTHNSHYFSSNISGYDYQL